MTRIDVGGGFALNVEVAGAGPPLALLHGFTGSSAAWGEFGSLLAAHFTTIAFDIVGHGDSDAPANLDHYTMERCVEDLVAATALAGFPRTAWLGYSMGARTALHVAAAFPEAVTRLVLIGGSPGIECVEDRIARRSSDESLAARIERDGVEAFVDYWQSIPLFATQAVLPATVREAVRAGRLRNSATGLANSLRGMGAGAQEPLFDRLAGVMQPTLLLAGDLDAKYVAIGETMAEVLPHATFAPVPGAGHAAQLEQPATAAALVHQFLIDPSATTTPESNNGETSP